MVLTKLCLTLVCTNSNAQSWEAPYHNPYQGRDILSHGFFLGKLLETRMNEIDRAYHGQAVYHALDSAVEGQSVEWFNDRAGSRGLVRIVWTHPSPGGWCRRVYSMVNFSGHTKTYEDTACYNTHTNTWSWIYK